ncbi:hypothetical protein BDU57DRAFT_567670 [Ampelomyces quisqualis]|uniref:Uncharacterized protein n=1 Tax=Ampelomyces quisqualis TaxID=50730 RepID=A0A6A5QTG4_AMPQU|nr:hypothetical protein BDU57DRAFT_567670 [Ampelomyces quisqualis]
MPFSDQADPKPPSTAPTTRPHFPLDSTWDISIPHSDPNGDGRTKATHAPNNPGAAASSIQDNLTWPTLRDTLADVATSASDKLQDTVNRAFRGRDVRGVHDSVASRGILSTRRVGGGLDALSDAAQEGFAVRRAAEGVLGEEGGGGGGDRFLFARCMAARAGRALVKQGICGEWQVMASRENVVWQAELHDTLVRLFVDEKDVYGVEQLFGMDAIWSGDVANEVWRLELDTGLVEVIANEGSYEKEEKCIYLRVDFTLPEASGCLRIRDVERDVIADGDWMAVE